MPILTETPRAGGFLVWEVLRDFIIPPRKNAKPWKPDTPGAIARNVSATASPYAARLDG